MEVGEERGRFELRLDSDGDCRMGGQLWAGPTVTLVGSGGGRVGEDAATGILGHGAKGGDRAEQQRKCSKQSGRRRPRQTRLGRASQGGIGGHGGRGQ